MLYAIISEDVADSTPLRKTARAQHIARLDQLKQDNRLVLAGPHPSSDNDNDSFSGSLIVAEFGSQADAQAWADADPYVSAGVYQNVTVKPFKKVLP